MSRKHGAVGVTVTLRQGQNTKDEIEKMIRKWKRKVRDAGVIKELQERREYVKPSVAKRKKKSLAKWRQKISNMNID